MNNVTDSYDEILKKVIALCDDVAWGRSIEEDSLYSYTVEGTAPDNLIKLAEAFGLMLVKLNIREEYNTRLIQELKDHNEKLEQSQEIIQKRNSKLMEIVQATHNAKRMVGQCEPMQKAIKFALSIANRPVNTLLLGETGTGKEEFAKLIHFNSTRCEAPFIAVNCSAIPDTLFESEMFGIEKGIATGVSQRKGLIEEANGGTLFLDEIADMPLIHQAKLLRVLEEQELIRVGSSKPITLDIKVISAANIDVEDAVAKGTFRMDLFYRLNVAEIRIPTLKERGDDILLLAQKFLDHHCSQMKQKRLTISPEARNALLNYLWPGNVRELNNEMERAVVLSIGKNVELLDLSPKLQMIKKTKEHTPEHSLHTTPASILPNPDTLNNFEDKASNKENAQKTKLESDKNLVASHSALENNIEFTYNLLDREKESILQALETTNGNRSQAALLLGITREGLRKKLLRMNISTS